MLLLYSTGIIKVTQKFRAIVSMMVLGYFVFSMINLGYMLFFGGGPFGFGGFTPQPRPQKGADEDTVAALDAAGRHTGTVTVHTPGGTLLVGVDGATTTLTGPAELVAHGTWGAAVPARV